MCNVLRVSRSGYYDWKKRDNDKVKEKQDEITRLINQIYIQSKGRYGSPRITKVLKAMGIVCNKKKVVRIMQKEGIRAKTVKRYRINTTQSKHNRRISPNLLLRNFNVSVANKVWVGDITYIHTKQGWLYLSVVIDLYSRKVIGWNTDKFLTDNLVIDSMKKAIRDRKDCSGVTFHSDRGVQYTSREFRKILRGNNILQSMSRKADCWDNAVVESFFHTLKTELVYLENFKNKTREQANIKLFEYIELFYNRDRLHSYTGYLSPVKYEKINGVA